MQTVSPQDLQDIVTAALERMAFVVAEPAANAPEDVIAEAVAHAVVELHGARGLALSVSVSAGIVTEIASGMLGCEPEALDPAREGPGTVTELANVFGGELVMQMTAEDETMHLGLPREIDAANALRFAARALLEQAPIGVVASDCGRIVVALTRR